MMLKRLPFLTFIFFLLVTVSLWTASGASAQSLDPTTIPKYVTPLLIPPVMPKAGTIVQMGGKNVDYYEISVRQFQQQILPPSLPQTMVWGYGAVAGSAKNPLVNFHNAPSLTIEAKWNKPVRIKWINELRVDPNDPNSAYLPHLLPVDPTLHWANPPRGSEPDLYGTGPRDSRPTFTSTPGPYTGPVPMVVHVHGAVAVRDDSDGYAEAWYLPAANNIPLGYVTYGTWYNFFKGKAEAAYNVTWGPGYAVFQYPNSFRAATLWYHDHTLGMTAQNVYAGPAGFFMIRGGPGGDDAVIDTRSGCTAVLPGPAPKENDKFPPKKTYYEIPMAIQDRAFNSDGSLFYPDSRAYFGDVDPEGPINSFIPRSDVAPIHNPEFFGNTIIVNGNTWPKLTVEARRYRFRFLNGCNSRMLVLKFNDSRVKVWQIGNEAGFLKAPVNINATPPDPSVADSGKAVLLMGGAERADIIVDFSAVPPGTQVMLLNLGPDSPFGGFPIPAADGADPNTTGQVMRFDVVPTVSADLTTPPQFMKLPAIKRLPMATTTRKLLLAELTSPQFGDVPVETRLGVVDDAGNYEAKKWADAVTENPAVGATEIWEFYNTTVDAHPMHIHEVAFEVINRQALLPITNQDTELGTGTVQADPNAPVRGPQPWEMGRKDTVIALPGEVTRVKATFSSPGQFVWHCHIVEHEDNEMMRPLRIGPVQPGQPTN
jgi:FtsP/CotA-like multicopper oxidase with cupredoxin domain